MSRTPLSRVGSLISLTRWSMSGISGSMRNTTCDSRSPKVIFELSGEEANSCTTHVFGWKEAIFALSPERKLCRQIVIWRRGLPSTRGSQVFSATIIASGSVVENRGRASFRPPLMSLNRRSAQSKIWKPSPGRPLTVKAEPSQLKLGWCSSAARSVIFQITVPVPASR